MIENEQQYRITKDWIERFRESLGQLEEGRERRHPLLHKALHDSYESQIRDLCDQLVEYEARRRGEVIVKEPEWLQGLGSCLFFARFTAGMTEEQLAERVGTTARQIRRYEATGYRGASLARVAAVAEALGMTIDPHVELPPATEDIAERLLRLPSPSARRRRRRAG